MRREISIPLILDKEGKMWLVLKHLSDTGLIRAATIKKPRHVADEDGHHCEECFLKTSIRFHPKKYKIN